MKEWNNPELMDLSVSSTLLTVGGNGNDGLTREQEEQFLKDNPPGVTIGRRS